MAESFFCLFFGDSSKNSSTQNVIVEPASFLTTKHKKSDHIGNYLLVTLNLYRYIYVYTICK